MLLLTKALVLFPIILVLTVSSNALSYLPVRTVHNQQQLRPLSLDQIRELIRNSSPDAAIAIEIQRRGIAFQLDSNALDDLRKLGAGPKTMQSLNVRLQTALEKEDTCQSIDRIVILVANFKNLDDTESDAAITETILDQLGEAARTYREIGIQ